MHKLCTVSFRGHKRKNVKYVYCTTPVLWCSVFKIHFSVKWHKLCNDQSMGRSVVTKGVSDSAQHGILSNTPHTLPSTTVTAPWSLATTGSHNQGGLHAQCARSPLAKTTISALQLEVHLQVADGAPQQCPQWLSHACGGHWTHMLYLSTKYYLKWAHLQDCIRRGPSVWTQESTPQVVVQIQLIIMKYSEDPQLWRSQLSCDIAYALIPQLLLWHLHWLTSVQSMGDLHSSVLLVWHGDTTPITLAPIIICMTSTLIK
jgi:hypothetical protein